MKSVTCVAMGLLAAILGAGASAQPPAEAAFAGGLWQGRAPGGCLAFRHVRRYTGGRLLRGVEKALG